MGTWEHENTGPSVLSLPYLTPLYNPDLENILQAGTELKVLCCVE